MGSVSPFPSLVFQPELKLRITSILLVLINNTCNSVEDTANMMRYPGHDGGVRIHSGGSAIGPQTEDRGPKKTGESWWDKLAWICCGIDREEDGEIGMQRVRTGRTGPPPLFIGATNTSVPNVDVGA